MGAGQFIDGPLSSAVGSEFSSLRGAVVKTLGAIAHPFRFIQVAVRQQSPKSVVGTITPWDRRP
jgi:hypothetical protein